MGNIAIGFSLANKDTVTVTSSTALSSAPASNLALKSPKKFWQTTGFSSEWCKFDFGEAINPNAISLAYAVVDDDTDLRIQANTTDDFVSPPVDILIDYLPHAQPVTKEIRFHSWYWDSGGVGSYRWWRLLPEGTVPAPFFRAGRAIFANPFQPTINVQYGFRTWYEQEVDEVGGDPATRDPDADLVRYQEISLAFPTEAEMMDNLFALQAQKGSSEDVFVVFDPDATSYVLQKFIYGVIDDLGTFELGLGDRWTIRLVIKEML